jgi:muramoyltetrapeptide carboxypeptidase
VAATAATVAFPAASQSRPGGAPARLVKAPRLKPKSLVGLIAPGGVVSDTTIQKCVANLEGQGFTVKPGRNIRAAHGGYAGSVAQRLEDLHAMFADREVAAIWAARGGSGSLAILPGIDYALVQRKPKILIGYSEITALHAAMLRHAGLVTFHGPVASSTFSDFSVAQMLGVLAEPARTRELPIRENVTPRVFREGVAQGRLVGGNLSVFCALAGTPYAPPDGGHLLFLEEVGEAPYRIDRMLTQLELAGVSRKAAGVVMGVFDRCEAADGDPSLTLAETLEERMRALAIPSGYGYAFGHITRQVTLPVGIRARFDAAAGRLTLLEPAVS